MSTAVIPRPARLAGRILVAALLLLGAPGVASAEDTDRVLQRADQIKYTHNDEFLTLLKQLDTQVGSLTPLQHDWVDYFHAWQLGYSGQYPQALAAFQTLLAHTQDQNIRARSRISLIYDQVNSAHFEDAYNSISVLLDALPRIQDRNTHFLILTTATYLYSSAGQNDLALNYVDQTLAYNSDDRSICLTLGSELDILYASGKLRVDNPQIRQGIDTCERIGDLLYANEIRIDVALLQVDQGHAADAVKMLKAHDTEVLATRSSTTISEFRSALARSYFATGDFDHASATAKSAIDYANTQVNARSVAAAYKVLYEIAKRQDDYQNALAYYEKYAAADRGYLNDTSARTLAYQMVHQQVLDKKHQIDALREQNKVLQLQQQVNAKSTETRRLYILLLLAGLTIVVGWAYRTKRSQIKFQRLARRDGLTGISNRQHFFESAQDALRYCAKNAREASVVAMDLDHFKSINDMHGHAAGDAVLKRAVAVCQAQLRSIDLFGRMGGEEFAILLPDCNAATAALRANQMREAIAVLPGSVDAFGEAIVTASFGVAATPVCGYNLPTLLAHADNALYAAKRAGRNRVSVHRAGAKMAG
ncbi:MAG: tetratricopeptide repeat-containing diguanylate cyclase [Rudaea sp.]